ncbi:hypothetical protein F2P81_009605 [Scophthalmus maximus]|uniref:Uncharacterized protein n=1 Tax=Scophthalmus maximus TaxID=52904 RepID=A0A6A4T7S6_SCOMX|nr:hypothetical protein F2P81_009605 [Scophthalmus maximus]
MSRLNLRIYIWKHKRFIWMEKGFFPSLDWSQRRDANVEPSSFTPSPSKDQTTNVHRGSDVGDGGRPAASGKQCVRHGKRVEILASRAGRGQRAPPPPAAEPNEQSYSR